MSGSSFPQRWLVIILTHNEPISLIKTCLHSVREATNFLTAQYPTSTVHVRVVDDSTPQLQCALQEIAESLGIELVNATGTISQKRNIGCRDSEADVVVFTDADCGVDQRWLATHAAAYARYPTAPAVAGVTVHQAESTPGYTAMRCAGLLVGFQFPEIMSSTLWAPCSNLSLRMDVFKEVGGFDETFTYGAEDVDLGLRVCDASGQRIVCEASSIVYHAPEPFAHGIYRRAWTWGKGEALLLPRHPLYLVPSPPKPILFVLLSLGWALTSILIFQRWVPLVAFLAIFVLGGPLQEAWETKVSWPVVIRTRLLRSLFYLGTYMGLLKARQPGLLGKQMNYGDGQFAYEWSTVARDIWEFFIFVLIIGVTLR